MKLLHFALAFMLLLTACSKDDEKKDESFTSNEFMWTRDQHSSGVTINSTDAYLQGGSISYVDTSYYTWLDYGEIGSLQDIDIYNIPVISEIDYSSIPIRENHGYIKKEADNKALSVKVGYSARYITEIHRDKDGNILYIKGQSRRFVPYQHWE